jgi:hypothetical protein
LVICFISPPIEIFHITFADGRCRVSCSAHMTYPQTIETEGSAVLIGLKDLRKCR